MPLDLVALTAAEIDRRARSRDNELGCNATATLTLDEVRIILDRAIAAERVATAADARDVAERDHGTALDEYASSCGEGIAPLMAAKVALDQASRDLSAALATYRATKEQP